MGAVNVNLVGSLCQVTVSDYEAICTQTAETRFRFWCPSHGAGLPHLVPAEYRVWNGHGDEEGKISLFDPPKGARLPLPKAPPHPMLDGHVIPFTQDGEPLADLKLTETEGGCSSGGMPAGYPRAYPDGYPVRCGWGGSGMHIECFKRPGPLAMGDVVLCPDAPWKKAYDPMRFIAVKVTEGL
jgi:hypothetical protein